MKLFIALSFAAALMVGVMAIPQASATLEIAKKEKTKCLTCHIKMGKPELNGAGEYYKEHGTLKGYEEKK